MRPKKEVKTRFKEHKRVEVSVRVRPLIDSNDKPRVIVLDKNHLQCLKNVEKNEYDIYEFENVFGPDTSQLTVYLECCKPLLHQTLTGGNTTIFAYGPTGTGKTYTVFGTPHEPGVVMRCVKDLFSQLNRIECTQPQWLHHIQYSYCEIYNEGLHDLLEPGNRDLQIRQDVEGQMYISGLSRKHIKTHYQFTSSFAPASDNRKIAATALNDHSSRSHVILTFIVERLNRHTKELSKGKMNIIDLAGSENNRRTNNDSERIRESGAINISLLALGQVVDAINTRQPCVPYRASKLTRLLQDSLGGSAACAMIVTLAPEPEFYFDNCTSLYLAKKAKNVVNTLKFRSTEEAEEHMARWQTFGDNDERKRKRINCLFTEVGLNIPPKKTKKESEFSQSSEEHEKFKSYLQENKMEIPLFNPDFKHTPIAMPSDPSVKKLMVEVQKFPLKPDEAMKREGRNKGLKFCGVVPINKPKKDGLSMPNKSPQQKLQQLKKQQQQHQAQQQQINPQNRAKILKAQKKTPPGTAPRVYTLQKGNTDAVKKCRSGRQPGEPGSKEWDSLHDEMPKKPRDWINCMEFVEIDAQPSPSKITVSEKAPSHKGHVRDDVSDIAVLEIVQARPKLSAKFRRTRDSGDESSRHGSERAMSITTIDFPPPKTWPVNKTNKDEAHETKQDDVMKMMLGEVLKKVPEEATTSKVPEVATTRKVQEQEEAAASKVADEPQKNEEENLNKKGSKEVLKEVATELQMSPSDDNTKKPALTNLSIFSSDSSMKKSQYSAALKDKINRRDVRKQLVKNKVQVKGQEKNKDTCGFSPTLSGMESIFPNVGKQQQSGLDDLSDASLMRAKPPSVVKESPTSSEQLIMFGQAIGMPSKFSFQKKVRKSLLDKVLSDISSEQKHPIIQSPLKCNVELNIPSYLEGNITEPVEVKEFSVRDVYKFNPAALPDDRVSEIQLDDRVVRGSYQLKKFLADPTVSNPESVGMVRDSQLVLVNPSLSQASLPENRSSTSDSSLSCDLHKHSGEYWSKVTHLYPDPHTLTRCHPSTNLLDELDFQNIRTQEYLIHDPDGTAHYQMKPRKVNGCVRSLDDTTCPTPVRQLTSRLCESPKVIEDKTLQEDLTWKSLTLRVPEDKTPHEDTTWKSLPPRHPEVKTLREDMTWKSLTLRGPEDKIVREDTTWKSLTLREATKHSEEPAVKQLERLYRQYSNENNNDMKTTSGKQSIVQSKQSHKTKEKTKEQTKEQTKLRNQLDYDDTYRSLRSASIFGSQSKLTAEPTTHASHHEETPGLFKDYAYNSYTEEPRRNADITRDRARHTSSGITTRTYTKDVLKDMIKKDQKQDSLRYDTNCTTMAKRYQREDQMSSRCSSDGSVSVGRRVRNVYQDLAHMDPIVNKKKNQRSPEVVHDVRDRGHDVISLRSASGINTPFKNRVDRNTRTLKRHSNANSMDNSYVSHKQRKLSEYGSNRDIFDLEEDSVEAKSNSNNGNLVDNVRRRNHVKHSKSIGYTRSDESEVGETQRGIKKNDWSEENSGNNSSVSKGTYQDLELLERERRISNENTAESDGVKLMRHILPLLPAIFIMVFLMVLYFLYMNIVHGKSSSGYGGKNSFHVFV